MIRSSQILLSMLLEIHVPNLHDKEDIYTCRRTNPSSKTKHSYSSSCSGWPDLDPVHLINPLIFRCHQKCASSFSPRCVHDQVSPPGWLIYLINPKKRVACSPDQAWYSCDEEAASETGSAAAATTNCSALSFQNPSQFIYMLGKLEFWILDPSITNFVSSYASCLFMESSIFKM